MIDIDPHLETRLRSFYEHIEEQGSPGFASLPPPVRARTRKLNLVVGVAAAAVVGAGIIVFASELHNHQSANQPGPAATPSATHSPLPSASRMTAPLPAGSRTVIPVMRGRGSATLRTFVPEGLIFIEYACAGEGTLAIGSTSDQVGDELPCAPQGTDAPVQGIIYPAIAPIGGEPLTLKISAGSTTTWEIVVADGGPVPPLPTLGFSSAPTDSRVLVEGMYGTGTTEVGPFSPTGALYVLYACTGSGAVNFFGSNGTEKIGTRGACANGTVGTEVLSVQSLEGPVELSVSAGTKTLWEIVVYEFPGPKT